MVGTLVHRSKVSSIAWLTGGPAQSAQRTLQGMSCQGTLLAGLLAGRYCLDGVPLVGLGGGGG